MKRLVNILLILLIGLSILHGQDSIQVKGFIINDDKNPLLNRNVLIKMFIADSVYQSTFVTYNGFFRFFKWAPTKDYKIICYAYNRQLYDLKIKKIEKKGLDSLICKLDSIKIDLQMDSSSYKRIEILVYFGYPTYTDFHLSLFSKKYGFLYQNMGCIAGNDKEINKRVIRKLDKDLGLDWDNVFFTELEYWNKDKY